MAFGSAFRTARRLGRASARLLGKRGLPDREAQGAREATHHRQRFAPLTFLPSPALKPPRSAPTARRQRRTSVAQNAAPESTFTTAAPGSDRRLPPVDARPSATTPKESESVARRRRALGTRSASTVGMPTSVLTAWRCSVATAKLPPVRPAISAAACLRGAASSSRSQTTLGGMQSPSPTAQRAATAQSSQGARTGGA